MLNSVGLNNVVYLTSFMPRAIVGPNRQITFELNVNSLSQVRSGISVILMQDSDGIYPIL